MRVLVFSSLFPNAAQPTKGVFVQARLRQLLGSSDLDATVVAPVPWFPFKSDRFGEYGAFARAPREETQYGIRVLHPRYPVIPKVGMSIAPWLMARAVMPTIRRLHAAHAFDLIDAHYVYPDGVAATAIARELGLPNTMTARGTDITLIPNYERPRRQILRAAQQCGAVISVCEALKRDMTALGVDPDKITVLRNGVDLEFFRPNDTAAAAPREGRRRLVSVGYLIERKRHHLAIDALAQLPDCDLRIAGTGPLRGELERRARAAGVHDRVEFLGQQSQQQLVDLYNDADCLLLMSSREGMANVILESLACGTPVVATNVGGADEVLTAPVAGQLVDDISAAGIASRARGVLDAAVSRGAVRAFAERFSWQATSAGQLKIFNALLAGQDAPVSRAGTGVAG
ncbi:MAG: glycosyltransferase [Pseudomonadota bacterium]